MEINNRITEALFPKYQNIQQRVLLQNIVIKYFKKKDTILILNNEKERIEKCLGFNERSFKYLL